MPSRNSRMQQWVNYRVRVTLYDSRMLVGTFLAFDRHMNLVLAECDEFRLQKQKGTDEKKEIKRNIGLILIRGENIVSLTAEAPPANPTKRTDTSLQGTGRGIPVGRGGPIPTPMGMAAPHGLGPLRGMGGPMTHQMMPQPAGLMRPPPGGMVRPPAGGGGMIMGGRPPRAT